jgi:hypothetical protein
VLCGCEVWISDSMWPEVEAGNVTPHCMACGADLAALDHSEFELHPRVAKDMAEAGLLAQVQAFTDALNRVQSRRRKSWRR